MHVDDLDHVAAEIAPGAARPSASCDTERTGARSRSRSWTHGDCGTLGAPGLTNKECNVGNVTVIGAQWGDEGKGKIVDWLASRADMVVRFQGGHNAGHTLVVDGTDLQIVAAAAAASSAARRR